MAVQKSDPLKKKLAFYRIAALALVAFLLVYFGIVDNGDDSKGIGLYIFALIIALPITMLLDKYIVRFAKKH